MSRKIFEIGNLSVTRYLGPSGKVRFQFNVDQYYTWIEAEEAARLAEVLIKEAST